MPKPWCRGLDASQMRLFGGFDVGVAKLGVGWTDVDRMESIFQEYDLTTWGGKKHKLHWEQFGACVHELFTTLRPLFKVCETIAIERTPVKVYVPKMKRAVFTNPDVIKMQIYIEQTIRVMYPHVEIFYTHMQSLRIMFGSTGGKTREQRKKLSLKTSVLSDVYKAQYKSRFGTDADAMEAVQHSLFIYRDYAAHRKRHPPPPKNRIFGKKQLSAPVRMPALSKKQRVMMEKEEDKVDEDDEGADGDDEECARNDDEEEEEEVDGLSEDEEFVPVPKKDDYECSDYSTDISDDDCAPVAAPKGVHYSGEVIVISDDDDE